MAKCPIDTGRPAPGMHGSVHRRKLSDYGMQLREKQRLRRQYGLQERQFRLFFERALKRRGVTGEYLLQLLEMRLDNIVFRLGWALSRRAARQMVTHRHILVDGHSATIPSMVLRPGATVLVKDYPESRALASRALEVTENRPVPAWLTRDGKTFSGEVLRAPTREEIAPVVNEQMIVEFYSK